MARIPVEWSDEALDDFDRLYDFLRANSPEAARSAASAILEGIELLEVFPGIGHFAPETGYRELLVAFGSGAYVIWYGKDADKIVVLRIWHSREDGHE